MPRRPQEAYPIDIDMLDVVSDVDMLLAALATGGCVRQLDLNARVRCGGGTSSDIGGDVE